MTHPTRPSTFRRFSLKPLPLALLLAMAPAHHAFAQVFNGVQSSVNATIHEQSSTHTHVTTSGAASMIKTVGFGVGADSRLSVAQDSVKSALLIGVTGYDPSFILGQISSNGRVFISNPNGILFGANARIDVGGLMATTLSIRDEDFLSGRYQFNASTGVGQYAGRVINKGQISAPGGHIVLAGHEVTNEGLLSAPGGRVGLVASDEVLVDVEGDGLLFFNVKAGDAQTRLRQLGRIEVDGGSAELMAAARGAFADTVLNMSGVVQARSVGTRNGRIVIDGGSDGVTQVSGTLDASGAGTGQTGGRIAVLGDQVALVGQARLDASGDLGGGEVLVGGNVQGGGSERRASRSYVGRNVVISADALSLGDGGKVVVWADGDTRYHGQLSARGGALGGNGGFAEVSGHEHLSYAGTADLSAANGRKGQLLLDPLSIDIVATPAEADLDNENPTGDDLVTPVFNANSGLGGSSKISAVAIEAQLELADVTLSATNDINVNAAIDASGNTTDRRLTLTAGDDINLGASITTRGGLTLNAGGSATLDRINLTAASITLDAGSGTLVLNGHVNGDNKALTLRSTNTSANAIDLSKVVEDVTSLTVEGRARISENVTTSGAQSYSGTVVLNGGDVTLNANAGKITLGGDVDGTGQHLTLRSTSTDADAVKTSGTISNTDELTITGKSTLGGHVTTTGDQSYSADVTLGSAAVTLDAGARKIALNGALGGNGQNLTLKSTHADADAIETTGAITNVATFESTGKTTLNGNVSTTVNQTYGAALRLGANAVLNGGAGKIALNGAVTGNSRSLGLTSTNTDADAVKVGAAVTGVTALTVTGKSTLGANITTTGLQTYTGAVKLGSTAVTLNAGAAKIALNAAVDGNAQNLTLQSTQADADAIKTGGAVSNVAVLTVTGKSTLGGDVTTSGNQSYSADVALGSAAVTLDAGANKVALNGAINGNAQNLSLKSTHVDDDAIKTSGAVTGVAALTVTGKVTLGNDITTTGNQTYTAAVKLGASPATLDAGASKIAFLGTLDGNSKNLELVSTHADADAISTSSTVSNVGATFTVTGKSTLGGNVTTGEQRYDGLVTLGANTILNAAGGNKIALNAGVDGNGRSLGLTSTNAAADAIKTTGDIGGVTNLTVTGNSSLGGNVTTSGTQTYTAKATLATAANLQGTSLSFNNLDATGQALGVRTNALTISGTVTGTNGSTAKFEPLLNTGAISVAGGLAAAPNTLQLSQAVLNKFQNFNSITIGSTANAYTIGFGDFVMPTATIVRSNGGSISFAKLDGAKSLDARTSGVGTIALNDVVGGIDALASVLLNGVITLNTSAVTTTGNQTYTGAVTLGSQATTTLNAGAGKIDFSSTVDGNGHSLALTSTNAAADAIKIAGTVEDVAAFTVTGKSTLGGNVTTTGNQTYTGIVKLGSTAVTLDAGAGKVALNGGADGSSQNLTLVSTNTAADAIKTGAAITNVAVFTATGQATISASIGSTGAQSYSGPVTLSGNATLSGTTLGFDSTIDGAHALTLTGTSVTFGGAVGGTTALSSLNVTAPGGIAINGGGVRTSGNQTYNHAVALGAATTFSGDTLSFVGNLAAGSHDLTLRIGSGLSLGAGMTGTGHAAIAAQSDATNIVVGAAAGVGEVEISNATLNAFGPGFASLTIGTSTGTGTITFGNYTLTRDLNVRTGSGNIGFGTLDGAFSLSAQSGSGLITLGGNVGGSSALASLNLTGDTRINATSVQTDGTQVYDGNVLLGNNVALTASSIRFNGSIDSAPGTTHALGVTATSGFLASAPAAFVSVQFGGAVGQTRALSSLTVSGPFQARVNGPITTTTAQTWNTAVVLRGDTHFRAPSLTFNSSLSAGTHALGLFATNNLILGTVTGTGELLLGTTLDTESIGLLGGAGDLQISGTLMNNLIGGGFSGITVGNSTGTGTVNVGALSSDLLFLSANLTLQSGSGDITVLSQLNGAFHVVINTAGVTSLSSSAGLFGGLASLTTDAGGSTRISGTTNTIGDQTYGDDVVLTGFTQRLVGTGSTVRFAGSVDSQPATNQQLAISGNARFEGQVGTTAKLSALSVSGTTEFAGGSVSTTGSQSYSGNATLASDLALTADNGNVAFGGTINGTVDGAQSLSSSTGAGRTTTFGGAVGATTALSSVATTGGSTVINGGSVRTTGDQSYTFTQLGADTTLTGLNISVAGAQGARSLSLVATSTSTLSGAVSGLTSLSTSGTTALDGGTVGTSGSQTYGGNVTLGANTTLTGNTIGFSGTVDGARALVINDSGNTVFSGNVGGTAALTSLTTTAGGGTVLPASVRTTGAQQYGDTVTLSANTVLQANGVVLAGLIGANNSLQITSAGLTRFGGSATGLSSFISDGAGDVVFSGTAGLNTTGLQRYTGRVHSALNDVVFSASALTFTGGIGNTDPAVGLSPAGTNLSLLSDQLTFGAGSTVQGSGTLTIATLGTATSLGIAGGTGTLQLTQAMLDQVSGFGQQVIGRADGTGAIRIGSTTLARDTTLQSGTGTITATGTLDGARALLIDTDGTTTLQGNVGATTALTSLTITGATALGGTSVTTTGGQTYTGALSYSAAPTTLSASALAFGAGASGGTDLTLVADSLSLTGTLAGSGVLSLRPTAATTTIGLAGGAGTLQISQALLNQVGGFASQVVGRTDGTGAINAGTITLARNTTVQSSTGAITFNSTVDGARALVANTTGTTTFNGDVGATTALASLSTNAGGTTRFNGAQVRTTGAQTYGDALVYTSAATFRASALNFMLGATGGTSLTLISDTLSFAGPVSGSGTLTIQQAQQNGTLGIAGGTGTLQLTQAMLDQVSGFGQQVIGRADGTGAIDAGDVTLTGNTLVQSDSGAISFNDIDGAVALVVNTAGITTLGGDVGAVTRLTSLTTDGPGSTTISASAGDPRVIRTTGDVLLGDTVTVGGPLMIDATAAGNVTAIRTGNQFNGAVTVTANTLDLFSNTALELAGAALAAGGQVITNGVLTLSGDITQSQTGGSLTLTSNATPGAAIDFTDADLGLIPRFFNALQLKEASAVIRQTGGRLSTADGSLLRLNATQGGSINVEQAGNTINGQVSAVTPGSPDFSGSGIRGLNFVRLNSTTVAVGGDGIQADAVKITADRLSTAPGTLIRARLPYNNALGVESSLPGLTLVLSPAALAASPSLKSFGGLLEAERIQVEIGDATFGGFLTVRPKGGALLGQAFISLGGSGTVRPFYDGTGKLAEIPVYYNGEVPQTPQEVGALSAVSAVIEEARRSRFEEAVRTENVALRLRSGVIAEVGAGRPATEGSDSIRMPESCTPSGNGLSCQ